MSDDFDYSAAFEPLPLGGGQKGPRPEYNEEDRTTSLSDYFGGVKAGAQQSVAGIAAVTQYATQSDLGNETRLEYNKAADETLAGTSPEFQRRLNLKFFPESGEASIWNEGIPGFLKSVGAKTTVASPSLVAALIPAGVAATVLRLIGTSVATTSVVTGATAKLTASAQNAGDVANQIYGEVDKIPHKELLVRSSRYADLINGGMSEQEARTKFMNEVAGVAPIAAGAITYFTGGIEGQIGNRLGGKAGDGIIRGAKKGAIGEGFQEFVEGGTGEALAQNRLVENYLLGEYNPSKIANAAIEGTVVGVGLGGAGGGVGGIGSKSNSGIETVNPKEPDSAQAAALAANQNPVPPGAPPAQGAGEPSTGTEASPDSEVDIDAIVKENQQKYEKAVESVRQNNNAGHAFLRKQFGLSFTEATALRERLVRDGIVTKKGKGKYEVVQQAAPVAPAAPAPVTDPVAAPAAPAPVTDPVAAPVAATSSDPNIAAAPAASVETEGAAVADDAGQNVPETAQTLKKQRGLLLARQKSAVLFTDPTIAVIPLPKNSGLLQIEIPQGVIQFNPKFVSEEQIRAASANDTLNEVLDLGPISKKAATDRVNAGEQPAAVALVDKDGAEIVSALGTDQTAAVQADALGQMASPTDTVVKTTPEAIIEARLNEIGGEIEGSKDAVKKANSPSAQATAPASAPQVSEAPAAPKEGGAITPKGKNKRAAKEKVDSLTESGEKLLKQADSGVRFLVLSPQLQAVATENKISFEPTDDPNSIIEKLRAKKEATTKKVAPQVEVAQQEEPVTQFVPTEEEIAAYKEANTRTLPNGRKVLPDMSERAIGDWLDAKAEEETLLEKRTSQEQNLLDRNEQAKKEEEKAEAGRTVNLNTTNEVTEARAKKDGKAKTAKLNQDAAAAEEIVNSNEPKTKVETRSKLLARLTNILNAVAENKITVPRYWTDQTPVYLGWLRNVADMHKLLTNDKEGNTIPQALINQFIADEFQAKQGNWAEIVQRRREQGDAAKKTVQQSETNQARDTENLVREAAPTEDEQIGRQAESVSSREAVSNEDFQGSFSEYDSAEESAGPTEGRERPPVKIDENAGRGFSGVTKPPIVETRRRSSLTPAQRQAALDKMKSKMTSAQQEAIPDAVISKMLDFQLSEEEEDKLLDDLVAQVESGKPVKLAPAAPTSANSTLIAGEFGDAYSIDSRSASEFLEGVSFDSPKSRAGLMTPLLNMIRKKLLSAVGNVQIYIVSDEDFDFIANDPQNPKFKVRAYHNFNMYTKEDYVVLPLRLLNSPELVHVVMHELVHSATIEALVKPADYMKMLDIKYNIDRIMDAVRKAGLDYNPKTGENYGMTTVEEFVAEALSNPDFQEALSRVKISEELAKELGLPAWRAQSLYSAVINSIRELLNTLVGLNLPYRSSTALEAIVQQSEQLMLGKLPEDSAFYSKTMDLWNDRPNEWQSAKESRTEDKLASIPKLVETLPKFMQSTASDIFRTMLGEKVQFWSDLKLTNDFVRWLFTAEAPSVVSGRAPLYPGVFVTDIYNNVAEEYIAARKSGETSSESKNKAILDELDKRVPAVNDFMRDYDVKHIEETITDKAPKALPLIGPLLEQYRNREISLRRLAAEVRAIKELADNDIFASTPTLADFLESYYTTDNTAQEISRAMFLASQIIDRRLDISSAHAVNVTMADNFSNPFNAAYETGKAMIADVLHGTSYAFDEFSRAELGKTTGAPSAREGFFFARSPTTSQSYIDISEGDIKRRGGTASQRMITSRIKMDNPLVFDFEGQQGRVFRYSELIKQAKEEGRDGVVMLNTHDGGPTDTIYVVFNEDQISDRFKKREEGVYFPMRDNVISPMLDFGAQETAANTASGFGAWVKKVGISGMSLTQIAQQYAGTFVKDGQDLLDNLTTLTRKMDPYADGKREQAEQLAQRFIEYQRLNRDEANQFTDLGLRATMAGVNLGANADNSHLGQTAFDGVQAKKLLPGLQADFARLTLQGKALWQEMTQFFRDQQNEMTRGLVDNILDTLPEATQTAIGAGRTALVSRVMAGTLTEADNKLIDSPTVSKALTEAAELRSVKGTYFPLMRFGNHVVETLDKWGDLKGGKTISDDQVEFKATTDKEARAKAEAFVKDSDLQYLSRKVEYYDPATGKRVNATDAKNLTAIEVRYVVRMQRRGVHFFETAVKANEFRKQALSDGYDKVSEVQTKRDTALGSAELTTAQLTSLLASIESRKDLSAGAREQMRSAMYQASARLMAGNRVQKRSIARQKVEGASNDFARVLLQYGEATSRYLAKIKFMPQIRQIMSDMREVTQEGKYEKGQADRVELLNHLSDRIERNVLSTSTPGAIVQTWLQLSYIDKLGSLAYSITNSLQTIMVSYPVLAGRFGATKTGLALTNAYRAIGYGDAVIGGLMNTMRSTKQFAKTALLNTDDILGGIMKSVGKEKDGKNLTSMLDVLVEQGLISKESGFELAGSISQGAGAVRTNLNKIDRIMRQLPTAIEAINRSTTAIAAYRMAVEGGMSHEKATDFALKTVDNTQGDYRSSMGATAFNNPLLRPALQFKRYAQMMTYLMADMTNRAFRDASPKERAVARKQLMQLVGVQIAMAGSMSLPGLEIVKVAFMIAAALGFGDGWDDQEEKLRKLASETLGKTWGELLTKGVVSRALGLDLSSRVSLADLWTFGEPKSSDRNDLLSYGAAWALGAPGSLALDWLQGVQEAGKGNYLKAAELLLPVKTLADLTKATRQYGEGRATGLEVPLNVIGLRSARQANEGEAFGDKKRAGERKEKVFKELRQQFFDAKTAGDRAKAISKNREWNRDAPLKFKLPVRYNEERRAS
jgi:hypothetical protein